MKKTVLNILMILMVTPLIAQVKTGRIISRNAKGFAQNLVEDQAMKEPLKSSLMGVMAINMKGDTLVWHNAEQKMIPASTMKTITTGLALRNLGPDYRFPTQIGYSGTIEDGILHGDLYIIGHGDPTIGSKDSIATNVHALFTQWTQFVTDAGIRQIDGMVIGDGRWLDGPSEHFDWGWEDLGTYYGAGGNGLCFYRNIVDINVSPGLAVGDAIRMNICYPQTPWIHYIQNCSTGEKDTGDKLSLFNSDITFNAEMRGTLAQNHYTKKLECSNKFGALTCAYYFSNFLTDNHIEHKGFYQADGYGRVSPAFAPCRSGKDLKRIPAGSPIPQDSLTVIGTTWSPELVKIARMTNYRSDNFFAETLMRTLGKVKRGKADYKTCQKYYKDAFAEMGLDTRKGIVVSDGSGLSRKNYIAPEFFCRFLKEMYKSPVSDAYLSTLASPGKPHYTTRLEGEPEAVRQRIFLKSGSMNGVRCFSGFIKPNSGKAEDTILFSVMTNNCTASDWSVYHLIDRIIAAIAYEN